MIAGKKIVLGVTASIAAYKSVTLLRLFKKAGAEVKVIITPSAAAFVPKVTLATLSENGVGENIFEDGAWHNHVELGRWADVFVIAPLSCNTMAKMNAGICDNLLLATYFSATCPVVMAPAMDVDMWHNSTTQENVSSLQKKGCLLIPVVYGVLASGLVGDGRMAEPEDIFDFVSAQFVKKARLNGKKVLITGGPTYEAIDPVRFIGNHSSGKMGWHLANSFQQAGAEVYLVIGPSSFKIANNQVHVVPVVSSDEMYAHCKELFPTMDLAIMAAAVADYKPAKVLGQKMKKSDDMIEISLQRTTDILKALGDVKRENQILVGFALETENEKDNARKKLATKNADLIVLNSLRDEGAGFGKDTNKITILGKDNFEISFPLELKEAVADEILNTIIEKYYA